jgi:hypothetical protein
MKISSKHTTIVLSKKGHDTSFIGSIYNQSKQKECPNPKNKICLNFGALPL